MADTRKTRGVFIYSCGSYKDSAAKLEDQLEQGFLCTVQTDSEDAGVWLQNLERGLSWSWTGHERLFLAKSVQVRSPRTQTLGGESAGFIYTVGRGIYLAVGAQINADRARSRDLPEPQRHPACRVVALLAQVCITRVSPAAVGCFLLVRKMSPIHESIFCHRKCNSPTLTPCVCLVFARSQPPTPTVMFSPCLSGFVVHR